MPAEPLETPAKGLAAAAAVDRDASCIECGYNLRGLPIDGTCPECGAGIAASLEAAERWGLSGDGLRDTVRGLRQIRTSLVLTSIVMVLPILLVLVLADAGEVGGYFALPIWSGVVACEQGLWLLGIGSLTRPARRGERNRGNTANKGKKSAWLAWLASWGQAGSAGFVVCVLAVVVFGQSGLFDKAAIATFCAVLSLPTWRAITLLAIVPVVRRWWISDGRRGGPAVLVWLSRLAAGCCAVFVGGWVGGVGWFGAPRSGESLLWLGVSGTAWFFAWLIAIISAATVGALAKRMALAAVGVSVPSGGKTLA